MARIAFSCTLGNALGPEQFNSSSGAAAPISAKITAVQALETAVTDAITAAEANGTIAGDGAALALVQAIGTAFTALDLALTAAAAAAAANNVVLDIDTAVLTTRTKVRAAVRNMMVIVDGSGLAP